MWTRKLDHAIFVEDAKIVWSDDRAKLHWRLAALAGITIMTGAAVLTVL